MTVCIVAAPRYSGRFVAVSDMRGSTNYSSLDDAMLKVRPLSLDQRWTCMFAADDVSRFESIYKRCVSFIGTPLLHAKTQLADVEMAVSKAYRAERERMALAILSPLQMDLAVFEMRGRARLGEARFHRILDQIHALDTRVEILVFGFDENDGAHIFKSSSFGELENCDEIGFAAIGTGSAVATDWLYGNGDFRRSKDIGVTAYRLCEAKFASEGANGVGHKTVALTFDASGMSTVVPEAALSASRALWDRRRRAKIPEQLLDSLRTGMSRDLAGIGAAKRRFIDAYEEYRQTGFALERLINKRGLGNPDQRNARAAVEDTLALQSQKTHEELAAWEASGMKPPGLDQTIENLISSVGQLRRIKRAIEGNN